MKIIVSTGYKYREQDFDTIFEGRSAVDKSLISLAKEYNGILILSMINTGGTRSLDFLFPNKEVAGKFVRALDTLAVVPPKMFEAHRDGRPLRKVA